jgi:hypothetical protein
MAGSRAGGGTADPVWDFMRPLTRAGAPTDGAAAFRRRLKRGSGGGGFGGLGKQAMLLAGCR